MAIFGLFKKTAAFHSVRQISLIALPPLRFPGRKQVKVWRAVSPLFLIDFFLYKIERSHGLLKKEV